MEYQIRAHIESLIFSAIKLTSRFPPSLTHPSQTYTTFKAVIIGYIEPDYRDCETIHESAEFQVQLQALENLWGRTQGRVDELLGESYSDDIRGDMEFVSEESEVGVTEGLGSGGGVDPLAEGDAN
ncbi:hypothetical protein PSPO01_06700 [Paraphaeosphaeria sporulosa]